MKQKKQNRILAALLAVVMMFQMLPMMAFAAEETELVAPKVKIGETEYETVEDAVKAATSGDTIILGEGVYSLGDTNNVTSKSLTFEGAGTDKTTWQIQAAYHGSDGWCDYSFDGSDSITFQDMTVIGSVYPDGTIKGDDLQGLVRVNNITLKNCVFNGRADYWGYESTTFDHVTFNAPGTTESKINSTNYSLWTYTGKTYTFRDCTFNSEGKTINVYRHVGPGYDVTVNFEDCTVNSSSGKKQALNINDSTMGLCKYILNISNSTATAERDNTTCTQLFGFGGKAATNNTGRTDVNIDGKCVWKDGVMQTHDYTDGAKEPNLKDTYTAWTENGSHYEREVTTECNYCHYTTKGVENGYKLAYDLNGGVAAEGEEYVYADKIVAENKTVTLAAAPAPAQEGVYFLGWEDENGKQYNADATIKLTANTKLTAQWGDVPPVEPDTPAGGGGEIAGVIVAAGTAVIGYYAGTGLLMHHYGLPYWPKNRSELALMLWEDADRPMPESTLLYPDIGQEEKDMDLQHAARWAMENELIPDLNWDSRKPEEEQKFFPTYAVSRARALHAWQKAQQLKQDA